MIYKDEAGYYSYTYPEYRFDTSLEAEIFRTTKLVARGIGLFFLVLLSISLIIGLLR